VRHRDICHSLPDRARVKLRIDEEDEVTGVDIALHGESA